MWPANATFIDLSRMYTRIPTNLSTRFWNETRQILTLFGARLQDILPEVRREWMIFSQYVQRARLSQNLESPIAWVNVALRLLRLVERTIEQLPVEYILRTIDLVLKILRTLNIEIKRSMRAWGIQRRINDITGKAVRIQQKLAARPLIETTPELRARDERLKGLIDAHQQIWNLEDRKADLMEQYQRGAITDINFANFTAPIEENLRTQRERVNRIEFGERSVVGEKFSAEGAAIGGIAGSVLGPAGTAIGAAAGGVYGEYAKKEGRAFSAMGKGSWQRAGYKNLKIGEGEQGETVLLPRVRTAVNDGKSRLGREAKTFYDREIKFHKTTLPATLTRVTRDRDNAMTQLQSALAAIDAIIRGGSDLATRVRRPNANIQSIMNDAREISEGNERLRAQYQYADIAYKNHAREQTNVDNIRREIEGYEKDFKDDLERFLDRQVNGITTEMVEKYNVPEYRDDIKARLAAEAAHLTAYWNIVAKSWFAKMLGPLLVGGRWAGHRLAGAGDWWHLITRNLWEFLTGPLVWGIILLIFQFSFMAAYAPPDAPFTANSMILPIASGIMLALVNMTHIKYPIEAFNHLISGIVLGYGVIMIVLALGLYYIGVGTAWGVWIYWILIAILWCMGAFEVYSMGGFKVLAPIAILVMVFAYFSLGPYSGYIREVRDQFISPIKQIGFYVQDAFTDIWLLMTNPTEYFARQQLKAAKPEHALSFPKGLELSKFDVVPESIEEGGEFAVYAVVKNDGEQEALDITPTMQCISDRYIVDESAPGTNCMRTNPPATPPINTLVKNSMKTGDGDAYQFRFKVGLMEKEGTTFLGTTENVRKVVFNKLNFSLEYTYSTSSSLTTEIATDNEIERRQLAKEQFYYLDVATAKVGPAMIGMSVGYQPLRSLSQGSGKAILLLSVLNKRPDGYVKLKQGTEIKLNLPATIGTNLKCSENKRVEACTGSPCILKIKEETRISNRDYAQNLAVLCMFDIANDANINQAGSRTGVITAVMEKYNFVMIVEKKIAITPSPLASIVPKAALQQCQDWFDNKQSVLNRITGLATDQQNVLNWYNVNKAALDKVAKELGDSDFYQKAIPTLLFYNPDVETSIGNVPDDYKLIFSKAGDDFGVSPNLIASIFKCGEHSSVGYENKPAENLDANKWPNKDGPWASSASASGPFQFIPETWSAYEEDCNEDGNKDIQNIHDASCAAAKYLRDLMSGSGCEFNSDHDKEWSAAACYNGGGNGALEPIGTSGTSETTWTYADRIDGCYKYLDSQPTSASTVTQELLSELKNTINEEACKQRLNILQTMTEEDKIRCIGSMIKDDITSNPSHKQLIEKSVLFQKCKECFPLTDTSISGQSLALSACEYAGNADGKWDKNIGESTASPCYSNFNDDELEFNKKYPLQRLLPKVWECVGKLEKLVETKGMKLAITSSYREPSGCDSRHGTGQAADFQLYKDNKLYESPEAFIELASLAQQAGCFTWVFNEDYQGKSDPCTDKSTGYHVHVSVAIS